MKNAHIGQIVHSHWVHYIFQSRQIDDLYHLARVARWEPKTICMIQAMRPRLDTYFTHPAQNIKTADRDLSDGGKLVSQVTKR